MITEAELNEAGIKRYDHPGTVLPWSDSPDGNLRITDLFGKDGKFIYKDHDGYYGLGKDHARINLQTIREAKVFVKS